MTSFQVERWREFAKEAQPIFRQHWEELALDRDTIDLSMDNPKYEQLDDLGSLHIVTARKDGKLVGYFLSFLMVHPHYKEAGLMAVTDFYYILPEARLGATGAQLLTETERFLRERGVVKAYLSCKIHQDHTDLFTRLGWKPTDYTFTKYLGAN